MSESNNDSFGLLGGLLALYLAYLTNNSSRSNDDKKQTREERINCTQIERIVNEAYFIDIEDWSENTIEFIKILIYKFTPSLCKKTKRENLDSCLRNRIENINNHIRYVCDSYKQEIPIHGNSEISNMIDFLIDECIFATEKIVTLMKIPTYFGNFNRYTKITNFFSKKYIDMLNDSVMYKALKKSTSEYFNAIYVWNFPIEKALLMMKDTYRNTYLELLSF